MRRFRAVYVMKALPRQLGFGLWTLWAAQLGLSLAAVLPLVSEATLTAPWKTATLAQLALLAGMCGATMVVLASATPARALGVLFVFSTALAALQVWQLRSGAALLLPLLLLMPLGLIVQRTVLLAAVTLFVAIGAVALGEGRFRAADGGIVLVCLTLLAAAHAHIGHALRRAAANYAEAQQRADTADARLARIERQQRLWQLQQRALRHDLRPPCAVLVESVERLQHGSVSTEQRAELQEIKVQVLRLQTRIDQLVEEARSETSLGDRVLLDQLLRDVLPELRRIAVANQRSGSDQVPEIVVAPSAGTAVLARADTLVRVLENLVANSVQAGAHRIWLSVAVSLDNVRLMLQDDGPGYPDTVLLSSLNDSATSQSQGAGLGLHWVATAMSQYGGRIELDNWHAAGDSGAQTTLVFVPAIPQPRMLLWTGHSQESCGRLSAGH